MDNRTTSDEEETKESVDVKTESDDLYDGTTEESDNNDDSDDADWKPKGKDKFHVRGERARHPMKVENEFTEGTVKQEFPDNEDERVGGGKKRSGKKRKGKHEKKSDSSSSAEAEQPIKRKRKKKDDLERSTANDENLFKRDENYVYADYDPLKTYYCFHKRCMKAFLSFAELKTHCAEDHNYAGSLRCGRCHNVYGVEEMFETHKADCTATFQCIDCGRSFAERKDFSAHVRLPCCDKQSDYKLLYPQTSKMISYSFSKTAENLIVTQTRMQRKLESNAAADVHVQEMVPEDVKEENAT